MTITLRVSLGLLLIGVVAWLMLLRMDHRIEAQALPPSKRKPTPPPTPRPTGTKTPVKLPRVRNDSPAAMASIPRVSWPQFATVRLDARGRIIASTVKTATRIIAPREEPVRKGKKGKVDEDSSGGEAIVYITEDLDNGVTLELVRIPGGEFTMGSPRGELDRDTDEAPQHRVRVAEFFMGRFEVTREQWRQVARLPKIKIDLNEDPARFKDSWQQPVEQVSWEEAVEFCARLQKKTGKAYRLPTEAEWEYACRAGTTTPFAFGATITPQIVNYRGDYPYGNAPKGEYRGKTIAVGSLGVANAFGLFDMHGNVWEWCEDIWHDNYNGAPVDGSAWLSGGDSSRRVLRGGSWLIDGWFCRAALRLRLGAGDRGSNYGFRVAVAAR